MTSSAPASPRWNSAKRSASPAWKTPPASSTTTTPHVSSCRPAATPKPAGTAMHAPMKEPPNRPVPHPEPRGPQPHDTDHAAAELQNDPFWSPLPARRQAAAAAQIGYSRAQVLFQLDRRSLPDRAGCMNIHDRLFTRMPASAADSVMRSPVSRTRCGPACRSGTVRARGGARAWDAALSAVARPRTIAGSASPRGHRQQSRGNATWWSWWPRRSSHAALAGQGRLRSAPHRPGPGRSRRSPGGPSPRAGRDRAPPPFRGAAASLALDPVWWTPDSGRGAGGRSPGWDVHRGIRIRPALTSRWRRAAIPPQRGMPRNRSAGRCSGSVDLRGEPAAPALVQDIASLCP